ncbi:hypothetical protein FSP39_007308 [Pinctada imbricata]|uniref:Sushi domain-containing protein n=1 Tax=Pinctada imbricata TaxID=66713 RepID=A0AA89BNU6_PINIB|nr:hypothetical protein FSP39_007308 [Pinctada imbricata]
MMLLNLKTFNIGTRLLICKLEMGPGAQCPSPSIINGDFDPGNNRVGTTRSASCLTDYEFEDEQLSTTTTCRADGIWSQDPLICRLQKCPQPTVPSNAVILPGNITIGSFRSIECLTGYAKVGGEDNIECKTGKVWSSWTGQCSLCSEPSAISNAVVSSGALTVGTQRTYSCIQNYFDNGQSPDITCKNDATWSATSFACSLGECPEPTAPTNANVLSGNNEIGSSRTISCQTGYAMTGSQTTITCQSSQVWTSWSGSCITCSGPSSISGATVSSGTLTVGSTRTYSCNSGYADNGQPATITCQSDATWSSTSFACGPVCPSPPSITNGVVQSGSNGVGSTRTISCNTGYGLTGSQTYIECQSNQIWTTFTGSCSTCSSPSSISYASVSSGSVTVGSQRTYSCNTGYTSNGQSGVITCQNDATWSSTSFSCNIVGKH